MEDIEYTVYPDDETVMDVISADGDDETERIPADLDRIRTGMYSAVGSRKNQQDAGFVSESFTYIITNRILAIMCDGMGGLSGGERASSYCVEQMTEQFNRNFRPDVAEEEKDIPRFFALMLDKLDEQVNLMKTDSGERLGAGTTLVSVILDDKDLYWASVGDSHIYIISDTAIMSVTTDHNLKMLLDRQAAMGKITPEEAASHPKREALVSFIGMGGLRYTDIIEKPYRIQGGDRVLLCSDGLYRTLTEREMADIVRRCGDDMERAARELVETAIGKGRPHQDNTTAVILKYLG